MPNNYVLLEKITVGAAGVASVTFANIPQTGYTDLVIKGSARSLRASDEDGMAFGINGTGATNWQLLSGNGSSASTGTLSSLGFGAAFVGRIPGANATANTFGNFELYLPNYTSSIAKSYSTDAVTENNGSTAYASFVAAYQSNTAAVSSVILLASNANLAANSTFYLYGVAKLDTTPAIAPKATGGDIIDTDGTYWYHTFLSSGTFTPQKSLTCDYLVVAGGGGGGQPLAGGGGAGGLRSTVGATGGGGSLETPLSLLSNTNYTVTIGAGGNINVNGSNSTFSTITSTGGGRGGYYDSVAGANGGSGGGGGGGDANPVAGGSGTANQGYAGGTGRLGGTIRNGGGGGGAGAVGQNAIVDTKGGDGGAGVTTTISGTSRTYAGGGGGCTQASGSVGAGGSGGGGAGGANVYGISGTANTGGGGGGVGQPSGTVGGFGGSGIVIVRYLVA
jgi:hypothetical protein